MDAPLSQETIAITGSTGFIGSHLARSLVHQGARPLLLARSMTDRERLRDITLQVEWATVDLRDKDSFVQTLRRARPTVLFHLAALRGRGLNAQAYAEANVGSVLAVLEAARQANIRRVVLVGSAAEYGPGPGPFREDLSLHPTSAYGASKAAATLFAQARYAAEGIPVVILRPFTVYGPGQSPEMFVAEAIAHAVRAHPFAIREGRHRQDLVYVDDTVEALLLAASMPGVEGQVINVGGGTSPTLWDIAQRIWRLTGVAETLLSETSLSPQKEYPDTSADLTRAREMLGWAPHTDLETGLRQTIQAMCAERNHPDD